MPFSKTETLAQEDLDYIYLHILKKAIEEYEVNGKKYFERVERFSSKIGSIVSGIVNNLNTADLVIADLTGLNHNVMYELGVRHSLKRGTIIISQNLNNLPSDLRDYLTVGYNYSQKTTEQPGNYEKFKIELHKSINEVLTTNKYDSPVLSYLQQKQRFRNEEEVEKLKANAIVVKAIHDECYIIQDMIKALEEKNYEGLGELLTLQLFILKLNNLSTALNELRIAYTSSVLYENITNSRTILAELNKMFGLNEYFSSVKTLPYWPNEAFRATDVKGCIERPFVNVFALSNEEGLSYVNMKDLFKVGGVLECELLTYLTEYIEEKARELGVVENEIKIMLES